MATEKIALEQNKWKVEFVKGKNDIVIDGQQQQSVQIYKCENAVITVSGKVTSISIDASKKVGIIFENVIAVVEVVNSSGIQIQANGAVPSITVDKTAGVTIFVQSEAGRGVEIITSSSTEVNVVTPGKTANDDPLEQPIPQQFITKFAANGKLETKPVEHVGV